jgi:hypothetical protein
MLPCYKGSVWLILDTMHVFLALSLAKRSLADFSKSQAKTKVVCTQHTKETTVGPFHLLHMVPMSDVAML